MDDRPELLLRPRYISSIPAERMRWVWQGRLAEGMITDFVGDPGLGKSTLLIDLVARVTTGRRMPDDPQVREPAYAVILAGEDDPGQTIRPRLDNAGADVNKVLYLDASTTDTGPSFPLSFPNDLDELDRVLYSLNAKLLVMDPLSIFLGESVDSNNDTSVRVVLSKLKAIAEKHNMAVAMARHRVKSRDTDPLRTGQGSMGILGAARFGFLVGRDPMDEERERVIVVPTKQNAAVPAPGLVYRMESVEGSDAARVKWLATTSIEASTLISAQKERADLNKLNDAREWVRDVMQGAEKPIKNVMDKCVKDGFEKTEIRLAIDLEGVRRKKGSMAGETFNDNNNEWVYYYPSTEHGGTPEEGKEATERTNIDPDEHNPGRTAPLMAIPDDDFSVE